MVFGFHASLKTGVQLIMRLIARTDSIGKIGCLLSGVSSRIDMGSLL
jgi:hypothetical protein